MQSVKLDERMFFLWTKEDLADTKKLGSSCEDMEAYHERLRVFYIGKEKMCSFFIPQLLLSLSCPGVEVSDCCVRLPVSDRYQHQHICGPGSPFFLNTTNKDLFLSQVRHYNTQPPFNFPAIQLKETVDIHVSIYAAHLYDSVVLYAKALDQIIKEEEKKLEEGIKAEEEKLETALARIPGEDARSNAAKERARTETSLKVDSKIRSGVNIAELARNGTRITQTIINMRGFQSISGSYIRIDANGDSEGNFTAFALKSHDYTLQSLFTGQKFHCDNYLMPVGEFHIPHDHFNMSVAQTPSGEITKPLPEYAILKKIDWPKGFKPLDMPVCGYEEEKCQGGEGVTKMAAIVLSILLVCAIIVTLGVYRKWKIEQEIEGLLWKINAECLQGVGLQNSRTSKHSLGSLISGKHLVFFLSCRQEL